MRTWKPKWDRPKKVKYEPSNTIHAWPKKNTYHDREQRNNRIRQADIMTFRSKVRDSSSKERHSQDWSKDPRNDLHNHSITRCQSRYRRRTKGSYLRFLWCEGRRATTSTNVHATVSEDGISLILEDTYLSQLPSGEYLRLLPLVQWVQGLIFFGKSD